jgi:hypothetical protein
VSILDDGPAWSEVRRIEDRVHLYLPPGVERVRGVFACFVFHSADPRELARLWKFALVTVPWPFEYDLGHNDKRNGRFKAGHPVGDMGVFLRFLEEAAREAKHPELSTAPIVGWLGQNGSHLCADLYKRVPERVLAWADAFPNRLAQYPALTEKIPFAYAWEFSAKDRAAARPELKDQSTPPPDLKCRATTYGFPHGIYSKFNFFAAWLDRCVALRLPERPGDPLKPLPREQGWAGDFNPVGEWNPIAPFAEARGFVEPVFLPDAYAAWSWRSYHSAKPDLKLSSPVIEYRKANGAWGGKECGLGYGAPATAGAPLRFAAETSGAYVRIEFHDGDRIVATSDAAPWTAEGVKLDRGLRVLFAVGVAADGSRRASRPGFLIVE